MSPISRPNSILEKFAQILIWQKIDSIWILNIETSICAYRSCVTFMKKDSIGQPASHIFFLCIVRRLTHRFTYIEFRCCRIAIFFCLSEGPILRITYRHTYWQSFAHEWNFLPSKEHIAAILAAITGPYDFPILFQCGLLIRFSKHLLCGWTHLSVKLLLSYANVTAGLSNMFQQNGPLTTVRLAANNRNKC